MSLIMVRDGVGLVRAPYKLVVHYDLGPVLAKLAGGEAAYLAVLDGEKLRRKGLGSGLDAIQASGSWIARDCVCSKSGDLVPLSELGELGAVEVSLKVAPVGEQKEASVILRVVALRSFNDEHDWRALGAAVALRVDTAGSISQENHEYLLRQKAAISVAQAREDQPSEDMLEYRGIRVQQLIDFRDEMIDDCLRFCDTHRLCVHTGRFEGYHVCVNDPCPYRLGDANVDDHRGMPFVKALSMNDDEREFADLKATMQLVVDRYIKPMNRHSGKSLAMMLNQRRPLKIRVCVTHSWSEPFTEFVDTLAVALDREDVVFVAGFALDQTIGFQADQLESCPFTYALRCADKLVVVMDESLSITNRAWCTYEISQAYSLNVPMFVWPNKNVDLARLQGAVEQLNVGHAVTTAPEEQAVLRASMGRSQLNLETLNQRVRLALAERLECYKAAVESEFDYSKEQGASRQRLLHAQLERECAMRDARRCHSTALEAKAWTMATLQQASEAQQQTQDQELKLLQERLMEVERIRSQKEAAFNRDGFQEVAEIQRMIDCERAKTAELQSLLAEEMQRAEAIHARLEEQREIERQRSREEESELALLQEVRHKAENLYLEAKTRAEDAWELVRQAEEQRAQHTMRRRVHSALPGLGMLHNAEEASKLAEKKRASKGSDGNHSDGSFEDEDDLPGALPGKNVSETFSVTVTQSDAERRSSRSHSKESMKSVKSRNSQVSVVSGMMGKVTSLRSGFTNVGGNLAGVASKGLSAGLGALSRGRTKRNSRQE